MNNKPYLNRSLSLKDLLESGKEPVSVVIISHQYLAMLIDLAISIKITGRYKVSDKDTEQISRVSLPTKASLLLASVGKKSPELIEKLKEMNRIRNEFAHQMFTEKGIVAKYLTAEFIDSFKNKALTCEKELNQIYNDIYKEAFKQKHY